MVSGGKTLKAISTRKPAFSFTQFLLSKAVLWQPIKKTSTKPAKNVRYG